VTGVRLIATVRADFLSRLISLPRFGQELSRVLYFVRPLPPERIRDVIIGPAAATNVSFESDAMIGELVMPRRSRQRRAAAPVVALASYWERAIRSQADHRVCSTPWAAWRARWRATATR
jgi:hypothetical protein